MATEMIVIFHEDERGIARSWSEVGEIVHCKDCRYFHKSPRLIGEERDDGWCEWINERLVEQDHYCSWGIERSEDD